MFIVPPIERRRIVKQLRSRKGELPFLKWFIVLSLAFAMLASAMATAIHSIDDQAPSLNITNSDI